MSWDITDLPHGLFVVTTRVYMSMRSALNLLV